MQGENERERRELAAALNGASPGFESWRMGTQSDPGA